MRKKKKNKKLDFEEVVSDSLSDKEFDVREKPLSPLVFHAVFSISMLIAIIFLGRTAFFIGVDADRYIKRSEANINQDIPLIAPRGIIVDREGIPLVENEIIFTVFLQLDEMIRNGEREAVFKISKEVLGLDSEKISEKLEDTNLDSVTDIILARNITREETIAIRTSGIKSLIVENDYKRNYKSQAFSHVIGYVNLVSSDDLRSNENLALNDLIGKSGLELFYDDELRGDNGFITISRNAKGELEDIQRTSEPIAGEIMQTTIDAEFQEYFYNRMLEGLGSLGRTSGVGLAVNPKNGEVLALLSFPSFDANNVFNYLSDSNRPLFNRAVSGLYSPGSTIKPVHGIAALSEGVVTREKQIFSAGFIEIPNPFYPDKPSIFVDWKPHGWVNIHSALARSSNVYFYVVGGGFEGLKGVGIEKLRDYWVTFGFDRLTGIDLPGEVTGFLPSPQEKEERTDIIWRVGDTYNISIGQGDLQLTPLELLNSIIAIAEGKAYQLHIAKTDQIQEIINIMDLQPAIDEVRIGLEDAVNKSYGTANLLDTLPMPVAAKTGSAQTAGNTKTNALFIGYAPADDPQIAVLVLIEDAREGSLNVTPIARDVFEWYYINRLQ